MKAVLVLLSTLLLSSCPVSAGEPKVFLVRGTTSSADPIEKARVELRELGDRIATEVQGKLITSCKAQKMATCNKITVKVETVYVATLTKPGGAGIVTFSEEMPDGKKRTTALVFLRGGDGEWSILSEDFRD